MSISEFRYITSHYMEHFCSREYFELLSIKFSARERFWPRTSKEENHGSATQKETIHMKLKGYIGDEGC